MYVRKQFMKQFFGWRYAWFQFHINFISYHWLQLISVQTDSFRVRSDSIWMYIQFFFALFCLRGDLRILNKESSFISYVISKVADFEGYNWLKIFHKIIREIPSSYTIFFFRNWLRRNFTSLQYDFVYNHCSTNPGGRVR